MGSKITRRAVLGTIVGGLIAAPFVIKSFRKKIPIEVVIQNPYAKVDFLSNFVTSQASEADIHCVFDSFLQKRESWLSLRGFSSQAQIVTSITTQEKQGEFTASDECHLMLSLEKTSKIQERGLFPYDYKLYYSNLVSGKKWTYTSNRNTGETNFSGDKIGVAKPKELVELLTLPLDFYWSMTNVNMQNALSLWNVVIEKDSPLSYCFEPTGKMNSEKMLPAKICFKDGNLSEFQSKRKTGIPFAITTYEKYVLSNEFLFPTLISLHFDKNEGNMENDMKISISLSDLNVV